MLRREFIYFMLYSQIIKIRCSHLTLLCHFTVLAGFLSENPEWNSPRRVHSLHIIWQRAGVRSARGVTRGATLAGPFHAGSLAAQTPLRL